MPNPFGIPEYEQIEKMNAILQSIADKDKIIQDLTNSPGAKSLARGDTEAGFYGFVQPSDMGLITSNPAENQDFNGANLALALGISSGTAFNSDVPLMKLHYKGKVIFRPLTGYRYSIPWDSIYNAGVAYEETDEGFLPPTGRCGLDLSIDATDNSINCTNQNFLGDKSSGMDYADTVGVVGDILVLKGWSNEANNGNFTIDSITNEKIVLSGGTLVTEQGGKTSRFYNEAKKVNQGKTVVIGDTTYRVCLMKGAGTNPTDSYSDSDRGAIGADNMWNKLILPLHEHAKLGNWNYTAYAVDENGNVVTSDWDIGLTDENLRTHYMYGSGSYNWCQEVQDLAT
ncbi:MAG TPA: hypothetical protein VK982_16405, partial [Bacteroidales bacterium]|nr:hypothetical protein [Bacteroidales bacterium]